MGTLYSYTYLKGTKPELLTDKFSIPTFDPQYGFKIPRKERESKISYEEMRALRITPEERDYCAHKLKDYYICKRKYTPFIRFCHKEFLEYEHCEYEDYVLRMKEYERERRLRIRERKKQEKTIS